MEFRSVAALCGAAGVALVALSGPAFADDFAYSFNIGGYSDYRFRGVSQNREDPTIQGSVDATYNIFYAGVWASGISFGNSTLSGLDEADLEVDLYGGIRPVWKSPFGDVTFDLGVIYYYYPNSRQTFTFVPGEIADPDYVEFKGGYSTSFIKNLTTGTTVYYSPEGTFKTGEVWTVESTASYTFAAMGPVTPSISGTWGWNKGESNNVNYLGALNGADHYSYWNAGVTATVDKIAFDVRYWDTDIPNVGPVSGNFCHNGTFQCDSTVVFSAKVTLP